tara:strand:+ start:63773 stop:64180 length:408 start_codon:yes stop_codon:yes gene_type:complete
MEVPISQKIILFDGVCGLCNMWVDWVIKKDTHRVFKYSPIQGQFAKQLQLESSLINHPQSIIYLNKDKTLVKSKAALHIAKELPFPWKLLFIFSIIPVFLRDPIYDYIAKNRYAWFGKSESCRIPTSQEKNLFIP